MKLKQHVTANMIRDLARKLNLRIDSSDDIVFHVPEAVNAEYDLWINLRTKEIEDYGLDDDFMISSMRDLGWIE